MAFNPDSGSASATFAGAILSAAIPLKRRFSGFVLAQGKRKSFHEYLRIENQCGCIEKLGLT